jgi:hypothetical protein
MSCTGTLLSAKLTKHNPRSWIFRLVIASFGMILSSCGGKPEPPQPDEISDKNYHFYIILSPINEQASKDARRFLMNAQEDGENKTKIFFPNHKYTIIQLCHEGIPDFIVPGHFVTDQNDSIEDLTSGVFSKLEKLEEKRKNNEPCTASAKSLVQLSTNLYDAASKAQGKTDKMIVLLQAPWSWEEVEKVFPALKEGMSKLAKTKKVEKIVLFGVPSENADKSSKAFEEFNQDNLTVFPSAATNLQLSLPELESIRKDLLRKE